MFDRDTAFDYLDETMDELKFLINSKLRLEILINLYHENLTVSSLHKKTDINYTSLKSNLNKLVEEGYIIKDNEEYSIKSSTRFKLLNILYLNNNLEFIQEYSDFFNNHNVQKDDVDAIGTLPFIKDSQLMQADSNNPYLVTEKIEEVLMYDGVVRSLCIYLHPNCQGMIEVIMNQESEFKVIVPDEFVAYLEEHAKNYKTTEEPKNICFDVTTLKDTPINIAMAVDPTEVIIGLVRQEDGLFNKNCALYSNDSSAIFWARQLYNEYAMWSKDCVHLRDLVCKNNNIEIRRKK